MIIGVPKEIKNNENRVALTPGGAETLVKLGHQVLVESSAGLGSGYEDKEYEEAGAIIISEHGEIFKKSELVLKVKEPLPEEYDLLQENQIIFTYLHLAAEPELTKVLMERKVIAIAYETIQLDDGSLPLLTPMSEVAGRMSVQIGAHFLQKPEGGRGVLLSGVPGVAPAEVVIIGGGIVGTNAAKMAVGLGAQVTILEVNPNRLRYLDDLFQGRTKNLMSNPRNISLAVSYADLLIGAVLIPGAKAPRLVTEDMVKKMKKGSVIVDVAIDQGGCIETIDRVTSHSNPVYEKHGVIHYAVPNIPGAVARTSTVALTNATHPYIIEIAQKGFSKAVEDNKALALGVNVLNGQVVCKAVAESLNFPYTPLEQALAERQ